jgi:ABC-type branched-subunit amino acid transport system permease subunit
MIDATKLGLSLHGETALQLLQVVYMAVGAYTAAHMVAPLHLLLILVIGGVSLKLPSHQSSYIHICALNSPGWALIAAAVSQWAGQLLLSSSNVSTWLTTSLLVGALGMLP